MHMEMRQPQNATLSEYGKDFDWEYEYDENNTEVRA